MDEKIQQEIANIEKAIQKQKLSKTKQKQIKQIIDQALV